MTKGMFMEFMSQQFISKYVNWKAMDNKLHVHVCYIEEKIPKMFLDFLIQKRFDIPSINHFEK